MPRKKNATGCVPLHSEDARLGDELDRSSGSRYRQPSAVSRQAARPESITCGPLPPWPLPVLIDSTGLKVYGAGQWQAERHGYTRRKWHKWRRLHLGVDADSAQIVAVTSLSRLGWQKATG